MVKGGKRYSSTNNDGKWFAHLVLPESETRSCETCTSTGIMLNQVKALIPQALNSERYPKWQTQQKSREYPFSHHDNKYCLKDNISVFSHGVGRRKCPDDRRQNNSHFCLCQDGAGNSAEGTSAYQRDFTAKPPANVPNRTRRFPHSHKLRSKEVTLEMAREQFMWFGQDSSDVSETLEAPTVTKFSVPSKP